MTVTTTNRRHADAHEGLARVVVYFVGGIAILSLLTGAGLAMFFGSRGETNFAAMVGLITVIFGIPNACVMGMLGLLGYQPQRAPMGTPRDPISAEITGPDKSPVVTESAVAESSGAGGEGA